MSNTVRTFVAIELPPEVKDALTDLIDELRRAGIRGLRLVRPEGIHLTLKFLGDVPKSRVASIIDSVSKAVCPHVHFELELGGVGAFPNQKRPRVLWVGVDGEMTLLNALQQHVENSLVQQGYEKDNRRFNPHLTLARIREETTNYDRQKAMNTLSSVSIKKGLKIPVRSISLMRSTLQPDGAVYDCLASMSLNCDSRRPETE